MAKTTSQILAENKLRRAEEAAIAASRNAIHEKQMAEVEEQNKARTAAILQKAANNAYDATTKNEMELALKKLIGKQSATEEQKAEETPAASTKPKVEVPLGSAYLTGNMPGVSSPYAAGIQAQQQRTPEQQKIWEAERNTALTQKAMEDYRKRQEQAAADQKIRDADLQEIRSWSDEDRALLESYIREKNERDDPFTVSNPFRFLLQNKKVADNYDPLVEKFGEKRLEELAETYGIYLTEQDAKALTEQTSQAVDSVGGAVGHNALGVGARLVGGPYAAMGRMKEAFERTGRYSTLAAYTPQDMLSLYGNTVVSETAQNIGGDEYDENGQQIKEGGTLRQIASVAYQGGIGVVDSVARAAVGGKGGALILAAANSFTQTVSEASKQGATPEQAYALGLGTAAIEAATEKIPLDEMFKAAKGGAKGVIPILKEALRQAGIEATTEELSLAGNLLLEAAVLREKSSYNQKIGELVANGASYEEAKAQADKDVLNEALQIAAVSGFSGLFSGGGSATFGALRTDSTPDVSTQVQQEVAAEAVPAAPAVEPAQQAGPSMEQLLEGVQDMTPAPAPMTETQQHFDNAAAIANGMKPVQKPVDTVMSAGYDSNINTSQGGEINHGTGTENDYGGNGRNEEIHTGIQPAGRTEYGTGNVQSGNQGGISGRYGEGTVHSSDSEGRELTPEISERIRGTAVTDDSGRPLAVYHFTDNMDFDVFAKGDTGFHFGSVEQANNRAVDKKATSGRVFRVHLNIKNPIRVDTDIMGWHPGGTALKLWGMGILTDEERAHIDSLYRMGDGYDSQAAVQLRRILEQKGYDGIVYPNRFEGVGDSYMAFRDDQIIRSEVQPYGESAPAVDTDSGVQMAASNVSGESAEGEQDAAGTVGAMQSQFRHEVKQSGVYGNTYKNTQYADIHDIGRAAKNADPNIDQYDVITEPESLHEAELRTQTGRDRLVEHNALMKKAGWTGADNDTAMKLLTAYRKEGKQDRFLELSRKQRQMGTQAGQMVQSFAKYSREDATVAVQDAIADLDELTIDQVDKTFWKPKQEEKGERGKQDAFQKWKESITGSLLEVANDIENVKDGDKDSMRNLVRQIANLRHTTAWMGHSSELTSRTERGLDKMDFDTLKAVAKTQLSMIPNDFRKRDAGEIMKQIRVQNMLFTLTTKLKNDSGNISNGLMDAVSDSFGGRMIDAILSKFTGQRTVGNDLKFAKEYSKAARDAADVAAAFVSLDIPMEMDTKYSSGRTRTWSPNTTNVLARMMSAFEKHMKYALEVSDKFYEGGAAHVVNRSLQDLGEKSNLTPEQIQDIAQKTGQRRTFKDPGASVSKDGQPKKGRMFARANVGLQRGLNQIGNENIGLGDLVMPFAAVSGEVKQVGMDYTGGGLISGLNEIISIAKDARNGKQIDPYRQRVAATDFGRGMTGVGLIAAFAGLAASGAIKVHNDRDSEERIMNQTQGLSGAQWNLNSSLRWWKAIMGGATAEEAAKASKWQSGDELITIDFLEPFNTQMHIGYLLSQGEDVLTAIAQGNFDSLLEMPMMQTLSDLADLQQAFTEVSDGDMGGVYDAAGQLVGTVAGSAVPNWARKTAQIIDPYYRNTYDTNPFKKAGKDVLAAVPFASRILPKKYDNLGKEQRRYEDGEWMAAAFDNLVTPWDTDTYQTNEAYQEIQRLNAIEGVDVTPPAASRKITYTDKNGVDHKGYALTDAQYETMQKVQGQTAAKVIDGLISSKDYAALTDEQKAAAIKMAYSYAKETAEIAAVENHLGYSENWMKGIKDREARTIIAKTVSSSLDDATGGLQEAWKNGWDVGTQAEDLKWAYDTFSQLGKIAKDKVAGSLDGMTADYVEARGEGISHETFLDAAKLLEGITPQAGKANPRDFQKAEAVAGMKGVSDADKTLLIKQQMSESQNENLDQMLDLGYSPEEYAGVLKIYRDIYDSDSKTKKEDFLKKLMDRFGMTRAQANAVYQIYK